MVSKEKIKSRIFEVDFIRGFVLILVVLFHLAYDLLTFLDLKAFAFILDPRFEAFFRKPFLGVLVLVSGISCSFSRNNFKRGLRMLFFALAFTAATYAIDRFVWPESGVIWFNIIHLVAVSTLIYSLLELLSRRKRKKKGERGEEAFTAFLLLAGIYVLLLSQIIINFPFAKRPASWWLLPFSFPPEKLHMMDYLPLFPWLGMFLAGAAMGRILYKEKKTRFPQTKSYLLSLMKPVIWIGENSLWVYILHQPLTLALVLGSRYLLGL